MKQSDAVYEVERLVRMRFRPTMISNPQEYVDGIRLSTWFKNRRPDLSRRKIHVIPSNHAQAWSSLDERKIWLPPWAHDEWTICHELGHVSSRDMLHGERFRHWQHALVQRFIGSDEAKCYRYACKALDLHF